MDRKMAMYSTARGARAPPGSFSHRSACEPFVRPFRLVASLPHPASKTALSRPVSRVLRQGRKPWNVGRRDYGGRKLRDKAEAPFRDYAGAG